MLKRGFDLGPTSRLQATIGVHPQPLARNACGRLAHQRFHVSLTRHAGGVDVPDAGADPIGIAEVAKAPRSSMSAREVSIEITSASISAIDGMISLNSA